jgi:hypothetical protein
MFRHIICIQMCTSEAPRMAVVHFTAYYRTAEELKGT